MSIIKRVSPLLNLDKYKTFIEDADPNSLYLKINEFKDVFTGGKNGFVIEGTPYLRETTEVKIEIKDVTGNTIYVEPGDGTPEYYEGLSKVISTHVYDDTPIGEGLVTILAELKEYIDENGTVRPVPDEWKGVYNLKWQRRITVNRNFPNEDKVRFYLRPTVEIEEIVKPVYNINLPTVTRTGEVSGIAELPLAGTDITNYGGGTIYRLQLSSGSWNRAVDENVVSVPSLNYNSRVLEVLNDRVVLVDRPYTVNGVVNNFTSQSFTTTFEDIEQQEFLESNIISSYAKLTIRRLSTFVGDVARVKIYRKSRNTLEDFQFVQDITLEATEFLVDYQADSTNELYYGNFYGNNLYNYWISGSDDHPIQPNTNILANSARIDYQSSIGGTQKLITSQSFTFSEGVEYTLSHNLLYRGGGSNTAYVKSYLSSSTYLQEINNTTYSTDLLQRTVISTNFIADKTDDAKLVFEFVGDTTDSITPSPEWYISAISLKSAEQTSFSPDEITFIQPIPRKIGEEIFDFRFDFYDINNNFIPVTVTATKLFDGGNDIPGVGLKSFTLESDLQSFKFDTEGTPNPINQQILFSVNKIGAFTGSITFASSAFDGNGNELTPESYVGGQYPGLLTNVTDTSAILTLGNFTGSRNDVTVSSVRYVATLEDVTSVLGIVRVIEGFPPSVLTAVASKNQFVFNPDDNLKPVTSNDFIEIFVNNRNFTSGSLTVVSASNLPSLEVVSSTPSASVFKLYAGSPDEYPTSWSYYTPTSSSNQGTYTFSQQDLSANVQIQSVIEGAGSKGLFANASQNQFFYKMTDLTPTPLLQNSVIQVKRQNLGRLDNEITVTSGSGKPPLTVVSDNLGIKTFGISASNYPYTAGETTYDFRALDLNNELYSDTVTISPIIAESQIAVNLTNENVSLSAFSTGFVPSASFDFTRGIILVTVGTEVISYNSPIQNNRFSASLSTTTNVSGAFINNNGVYGITRLDDDSGSVVLGVIYRDGRGTDTTFQKEVSYSKSKKAAPNIEVVTGPREQSVTANSNGLQIDSFDNAVVAVREIYNNQINVKPFQSLTATSPDILNICVSTSTGIITLAGRTLGNSVNSTSIAVNGSILDSENTTRNINDTISLSKVKKSAPNVEVSVTPGAQSIFADSLGQGFELPVTVTVSATEGGVSRFNSIGTPLFTNGLTGTVAGNEIIFSSFASQITSNTATVTIPVSYTDSEGVSGTKSVVATVSKVLKAAPTTIVQLSSYAQSVLNDQGSYGNPSPFTVTVTEGGGAYAYLSDLGTNSSFRVTPTNGSNNDTSIVTPDTPTTDAGVAVSMSVEYINSEGTYSSSFVQHVVSVVSDGTDGEDSYSANLSNEAFVLLADRDGNVISYEGSGTDIAVFRGETELAGITSGTPTAGQFSVTSNVIEGSITVGSITAGTPLVVGNHSNMTTDNVTIEYTINAEDKVTLTKVQVGIKEKEAESAYDIFASNPAVVLPADYRGCVSSYESSGTDIYAFYGSTQLTPITSGTPSDGCFSIFSSCVIEGCIQIGSITKNDSEKTLVVGNHSNFCLTDDSALIMYCVNAENRYCTQIYQAIVKAKEGAPLNIELLPSSYVFNLDQNGFFKSGSIENSKFTVDVRKGDIQYTFACEEPYGEDTYRALFPSGDFDFTPSVVDNKLVLSPVYGFVFTNSYALYGAGDGPSGSALITVIDNSTDTPYDKLWGYTSIKDGQSSFTVNLTKTNHTFKANALGCVSENDLSAGKFDIEFYNGLNQYTVDEGVGEPLSYASDTYRASVGSSDGITFDTDTVSSQLQFTPSTLTKDSGSAVIQITDNKTSCTYCRTYTFSKTKDGSTGVSILIDPANQILSGSVIGPSFEPPKPFNVIVEQNGTKFCYDNDLTNPSTFKITNVFSGSDITNNGNATSATITPITPTCFNRYDTTFCVCYRDVNSVISTPTQQRHGVNITVNGSTGPGIVFTGLWEECRVYQFDLSNGRRDAVLWVGETPGTCDTYYASKQTHTSTAGDEPGTLDGNDYWQELGNQDFFVAAKIGIFEESYIQNTLNIGTNSNGGISSANITLYGGTSNPYFSLGQNDNLTGQIFGCKGIWIGRDSDDYKASFVGDSGALLWDGCDLTVSGSIIATSGRFDGDVCVGGRVIIGPNANTPSPCVAYRDGAINEHPVTWQVDPYPSSPKPACWCTNIGGTGATGYLFVSCLLTSNNSNPLSDFDVVRADFIFTPNPQTICTLPDIGWPPSTEVYLDFQITEGSNVLLSKECIIPKETIGIVTETLCYGNISKKNTLQSRVLVYAYAILDFSCEDYSGDVTISSCLTGIQPSISLRSNGLFTDVGGGEVSVVGLALTGEGVSTGGGGGGSVTSITAGCGLLGGTITSTGTICLDVNSAQFICGVKGSLPSGSISGSSQLTGSFDLRYALSGSGAVLPQNLVSGSSQITLAGDVSGTANNTSITANCIVNADINSNAAIIHTKLDFRGSCLVSGSSQININFTCGVADVNRGGTGLGSLGSGCLLTGNGTNFVCLISPSCITVCRAAWADCAQTAVRLSTAIGVSDGGTGQTTYSNGELLIGNAGTLTRRGLCGGSGITILNGAGCITISGCTGTVFAVGGRGSVSGLAICGLVTTTGDIVLCGTLQVSPSNFASQTQNTFLAAPNGSAGVPTFRSIVAADVPTLNQNTTGQAGSVANSVTFSNSSTGGAASGTTFNGSSAVTITRGTLSAACDNHTHDVTCITTGCFGVGRGGTGRPSLLIGCLLVGNGTGAVCFQSPDDLLVKYAQCSNNSCNAQCLQGALPAISPTVSTIVQRTTNGSICACSVVISNDNQILFRGGTNVDSAINRECNGCILNIGTNVCNRFGTTFVGNTFGYWIRVDARNECSTLYNGIFFYRACSNGCCELELAKITCSGITSRDFILSSDRRIKCDIQPLTYSLDKLNCITPYSYNKQGKDEIGIIAQDLQTIYPQAVFSGSDGYLNISTNALPTILLGAVKELTERVMCLECMLMMRGE